MCRVTTDASSSSSSNAKEIPFLLQLWLGAARFVPKVKIAGLDFGFSIVTCLVLGAIKLATVELLIHVFGWPADQRETVDKAASSLVPILHSGSLVPSLWACLRSHKYSPSARFDGTLRTMQRKRRSSERTYRMTLLTL